MISPELASLSLKTCDKSSKSKNQKLKNEIFPNEIWLQILSNLDYKDLSKTFYANSQLRTATGLLIDGLLKGSIASFCPRKTPPYLLLNLAQESSGSLISYKLVANQFLSKDWIVFSLEKREIQLGFIGLAAQVAQICSGLYGNKNLPPLPGSSSSSDVLQEQECKFDRKAYGNLNTFLKKGWASLQGVIPPTLQLAYGTLFNHILNTFDTLCERPGDTMERDLQMSLVAQIWRVVDVLTPKTARDPKFDTGVTVSNDPHYYSDLDVKLERVWDKNDEQGDTKKLEFESISFGPQSRCDFEINWEWNTEKGKIRSITCTFKDRGDRYGFPVFFELTGIMFGENFDFVSLSDVRVKIPKSYFLFQ